MLFRPSGAQLRTAQPADTVDLPASSRRGCAPSPTARAPDTGSPEPLSDPPQAPSGRSCHVRQRRRQQNVQHHHRPALIPAVSFTFSLTPQATRLSLGSRLPSRLRRGMRECRTWTLCEAQRRLPPLFLLQRACARSSPPRHSCTGCGTYL